MSTSGVFERKSRTISLSHGGCSRAEVRGIPLLTLSISDLRKRKFLPNPKIFVVQDDLWCWHIPGPEFFACRVRRRVGRPFRIEEKPSMPTQPPKAVEIFNQATWHRWPGCHRPSSHLFRDCNRVESHCLCIQGH